MRSQILKTIILIIKIPYCVLYTDVFIALEPEFAERVWVKSPALFLFDKVWNSKVHISFTEVVNDETVVGKVTTLCKVGCYEVKGVGSGKEVSCLRVIVVSF